MQLGLGSRLAGTALALAALVAFAAVALLTREQAFGQASGRATASSKERAEARNGNWIAYSTAPATEQSRRDATPSSLSGSDVYLIRRGGEPRLVAGRGSGNIWNLCPAFAPNGRLLAYARKAPKGPAIVVVGITRGGQIGSPRAVLEVAGRRARCPKWSVDGSRLAYVDASGKIVVRGLDGSTLHKGAGVPAIHDFGRNKSELLSPAGDLVASLTARTYSGSIPPDCVIAISQPNLSARQFITDEPCSYAIAGWSPDGRKLLVMRDVSGVHFTMRAVSASSPFASTEIAVRVRVNGPRSWPGYGDVSWQSLPKR